MKAKPPDTSDERCDFVNPPSSFYQKAVTTVLSDDHLSPLLARALFAEAFQQLWPHAVASFDRHLALELSLERSFARVFKKDVLVEPLYGLIPTCEEPSIPYLLLNTTRVRDGRRVTLSPLYFKTEQQGGADDWHLIDYLNGPPLSAAAGTSARFPLISAPGSFVSLSVEPDPTKPGRWIQKKDFEGMKDHYVDGGFFDDSGAPTILELYKQLHPTRVSPNGYDKRKRFSMQILHIGNTPICHETVARDLDRQCGQQKSIGQFGLVSEIVSVIKTAMHVRDARVEYGLRQLAVEVETTSTPKTDENIDPRGLSDEELAEKASALAKKIDNSEPWTRDQVSNVQLLDQGIPVPLGWFLSERALLELQAQLSQVEEKKCGNSDRFYQNTRNVCVLPELLSQLNEDNDKTVSATKGEPRGCPVRP